MKTDNTIVTRAIARGTLCGALGLALAACESPKQTIPVGTEESAVSAPVAAPKKVHAAPVVIEPRPNTMRLPKAEHPLARPDYDEGRLDANKTITNLSLFFALSPAQRKERDALVVAQLDANSPSYHKWLTPAEYRERFGAQPADIERVSKWLTDQGLEVRATSPLGTRVQFAGKVSDLEAAFQTEMHRYAVGKEHHYAMATAPAMPKDLAPVVLGIHNTNDFYKKPVSRSTNKLAYQEKRAVAPPGDPHYQLVYEAGIFDGGPDSGLYILDVLGPPDWANAYDVTKLYTPGIGGKELDGTGITIGIVGTAAIADSDVQAFKTLFGLPASPVTMTLVPNTGASAAGQYGAGTEAILDVEWSGGIAKGATVNYVYVGESDGDVDDATFYIIEQNLAPVMSESYGGCEGGELASDADVLEENGTAANLMGITYMAAAGDSGAADCIEEGFSGLYVDMPGSFPGVTSVGGTQFPAPPWNDAGNLTTYPAVEAVWNEANNPYTLEYYMGQAYPIGVGAGGGGISSVFARPAYQDILGAACAPVGTLPFTYTTPMRQVPDLAVSAASGTPGYYIECTFDNETQDCSGTGGAPFGTPIGGTSASSPSFTGVVAILNQAVGERLGNINPMLYQLEAALTGASAPFHDVTTGNNEVVCGPGGVTDGGGAPDGGAWPDAGCADSGYYGFSAIPGYDCASGIGSIDGYNLVSAWLAAVKTSTSLAAAPTMTTEGGDVMLTANVAVDGASSHAVTGSVTFTFKSYTATGGTDLSWELGSTTITGGSATGANAALSTIVPPGLVDPGHQEVSVYALYSGDEYHLASQSAPVTITFAPIDYAIAPDTITLQPNGTETFTTTGGVSPSRWFILIDTTAEFTFMGYEGSSLDEQSGAFVAGPQAGYVEIQAIDKDGAEALAYITVGNPGGTPPWDVDAGVMMTKPDAGKPVDAGMHVKPHDAGFFLPDVGTAGKHDAKGADGSDDTGAAGGGGCSCEVGVGQRQSGKTPVGAALGLMFGALIFARRRRS